MTESNEPNATTGQDAAQGRSGSRTFVVLGASLGLIVLVMLIVFAFNARGLNSHQGVGGATGVKGAAAESFHTSPNAGAQQNAPASAAATGTH